jgi:hypothetical protein
MADKKITQLPSASIATGSNVLPIIQDNTTEQITVTNLGQGILNLGLAVTASTVTAGGFVQTNNVQGTGSLLLTPDSNDSRYLQIYNTSPTDTHITASGGYLFMGDDTTYVKVVNYSNFNSIEIKADSEIKLLGNTIVTGSVSITGSGFLNGKAILTSADTGSFYSNSTFGYYGAFCSTGSQTNPVANVSRSMALETTEHSEGVTITSGSRITIANAGVYNLQFSAQLEKTSNGTDTAYIWFKKNGSNVARSNTAIDVLKQAGSGGKQVAAWNYVDSYSAGDYVEIVWQSNDTTMQLLAATATGNLPAIPSIIATINQIS